MPITGQNKTVSEVWLLTSEDAFPLTPCQHIRNCAPNKKGPGDELIVFQTVLLGLF